MMLRVLRIFPLAIVACVVVNDPTQSTEQGITGDQPDVRDASWWNHGGGRQPNNWWGWWNHQHGYGGYGYADVRLTNSDAAFTLTGNTSWMLAKTGVVDTSNQTVRWTITATEGATTSGLLVVSGYMTINNAGTDGAPIGNIAVNLQTWVDGKWVSQSIDVADATHGDAATSVNVDPNATTDHLAVLKTNAASGLLQFMNATNDTMFSLVPQETIAPGATQDLLFAASFNNNLLKLPVNKPVRAEVIVTFGNASPGGQDAHDVDISGSGTLAPDDTWVRSVPTLIAKSVPEEGKNNASLTITDTVANIATTGTTTFSNPSFDIGATSGTVIVSYHGGTSGGTITNCANAAGNGTTVIVDGFQFPIVSGASLQACNTQTIGASVCTPGTSGCGWKTGDVITYLQPEWAGEGSSTPASQLLATDFGTVYASTFGELTVGGGFTMSFDSATAVETYLPASGTIGALDADLLDPMTSSAGSFGGDVVALQLDSDFANAGFLLGTSNLTLGSLTLCSTGIPALNGVTVSQFLAALNTLLGGGTSTYGTIATLDPIAIDVENAFTDGSPSSFAQTSLFNGACP